MERGSSVAAQGPGLSEMDVKRMQRGREYALREADEAIRVGQAAMTGLQQQQETVDRVGMVAESNEYLLAKSRRTLRGMTWSGWVANMFTSEPQPPQYSGASNNSSSPGESSARQPHQQVILNAFICPTCLRKFPDPDQLLAHDKRCVATPRAAGAPPAPSAMPLPPPPPATGPGGATYGGGRPQGEKWGVGVVADQLREQDKYLDMQTSNVDTMLQMGQALGEAIHAQNQQLDGVADSVEHMQDETRALTRMAGRLHRSVRGRPVFKYWVALQEVEHGRYLDLAGDCVVLSSELRNTGRWEAHERQDGVSGLRSVVSHRWLGQNLFGQIRVRGSDLGRWEEWEIEYERVFPLLCCNANSAAGGYVLAAPRKNRDPELVVATASAEDKRAALKWRVIRIEEHHLRSSRLGGGSSVGVHPEAAADDSRPAPLADFVVHATIDVPKAPLPNPNGPTTRGTARRGHYEERCGETRR